MIISDQNKFFFLHNPKVAGTSIRRTLFPYDSNPLKLDYQSFIPKLERVIEVFHVCVADIPAVWPDHYFEEYFKFGFVRDPYTRLISSWAEHKRQHNLPADTDFNEFARRNLNEVSVRFDWKYTHFCPQHYFFYQGNKCYADFIGRYERLDADWKTVREMIGVETEEFGHSKDQTKYPTGPKLKIEELDEDVLGLINRLYERDFKLFGYEMVGSVNRGTTHAHTVDTLARKVLGYYSEDDIRNMSLGDQCMYWRTRAIEAEHFLL
jgi:hypothetical protein